MGSLAIHYAPGINWQARRIGYFVEGLANLGMPHVITESHTKITDHSIVFGTTHFKRVEAEGNTLLVDRCSFGDTNQYVSLVWNGKGRRGDHKVPVDYDASRWLKHGVPLVSRKPGYRIILCGQHLSYSPHYETVQDWYRSEKTATHFKPHPAIPGNPTALPIAWDFEDCYQAITLNSSVAVQLIIDGVQVVVRDEGSMAFDWESFGDRERWLQWLAWTQWHWDEIREGKPIEHLWPN